MVNDKKLFENQTELLGLCQQKSPTLKNSHSTG